MTGSEPRPAPTMAERLKKFRFDSPAAGDEFPSLSATTLDGAPWNVEAFRGRALILETGSFT